VLTVAFEGSSEAEYLVDGVLLPFRERAGEFTRPRVAACGLTLGYYIRPFQGRGG
jgi:hypothetical protein